MLFILHVSVGEVKENCLFCLSSRSLQFYSISFIGSRLKMPESLGVRDLCLDKCENLEEVVQYKRAFFVHPSGKPVFSGSFNNNPAHTTITKKLERELLMGWVFFLCSEQMKWCSSLRMQG